MAPIVIIYIINDNDTIRNIWHVHIPQLNHMSAPRRDDPSSVNGITTKARAHTVILFLL